MSEHEVDLVVIGTGPGGEALATGAAKAGLDGRRRRQAPGRRRVPLLRVHPDQDDGARRATRVAEVRRAATLAGDVTITASWAPVARRIDEEATDRLGRHDRGRPAARTPARPCTTASAGWPAPAGSRSTTADGDGRRRTTPRRGVVLNPGTRPAVPPVDGLAGTPYWTNRDAVRVTELPGLAGRRRRRADRLRAGPGLRPVRRPGHRRPARPAAGPGATSPRPAELLAKVFVARGHPGADRRRARSGRRTPTARSPLDPRRRRGAGRRQAAGRRRPHAQPRRPRPGDRRARPGRAHARRRRAAAGGGRGSGRSATSPARARSRTSRCTSRRSRCATSSARTAPPARYHAVPHATFTDPEVGGVGMTEQQARDAGLTRAHRPRPSWSSRRAVSPTARAGTG